MRVQTMLGILSALLAGTAALPAGACELDGIAAVLAVTCEPERAPLASHRTTAALLAEHGWAVAPNEELVDCKPEGAPCSADSDCCSGACKPAAEGRVCVPK
jgi:hypothetical protein